MGDMSDCERLGYHFTADDSTTCSRCGYPAAQPDPNRSYPMRLKVTETRKGEPMDYDDPKDSEPLWDDPKYIRAYIKAKEQRWYRRDCPACSGNGDAMHNHATNPETDMLYARIAELEAQWNGELELREHVEAERDQLRARVGELERERDAYRRAKEENDERFMLERDEARQERDAARAECERLKADMARFHAANAGIVVENAFRRSDLRKANQRLEAQAARMREALEEMAHPPFSDSDVHSLMAWVNARAYKVLREIDAGALVQGLVEALQFYGREEQVLGGSDYQQHGTSSYRQSTDDGGKRAREALDAWNRCGRRRDGDG